MTSPMRRTTYARVVTSRVAAALAVGLALTASACSGESDDATEQTASATAEQTTRTPAPSTAEPSTLSESPSPSEPSASESASESAPESSEQENETTEPETSPSEAAVHPPPAGSGPQAMLLRAGEVPGLNDQHSWRAIGTANEEKPQPVWACQVTDFVSIGATDVWVRRFVGQPGGGESAKARSAVVSFADPQSAARAFAVLRAWHDRCEDQLKQEGFKRVRVAASPTDVRVSSGDAEWRLAIYGPVKGDPDAGFFDATGYARKGSRIGLVTMVNVGQDYNYPRGQEPIVGAVQNAATKLLG